MAPAGIVCSKNHPSLSAAGWLAYSNPAVSVVPPGLWTNPVASITRTVYAPTLTLPVSGSSVLPSPSGGSAM
jgi:hypothetical protein